MQWLKTVEERAGSLEDPSTPIAKALMFLSGERTITGRPMNEGAALAIAAFWSGVSIIAGDIGTIPLKVFRRLDNNGRAEENGHALWDLLTLSPADMITSSAWREATQAHLLLRGNAYSEIEFANSGRVLSLQPHHPVNVRRNGGVYTVDGKRRVDASRMLHIPGPGGNGIDGYSVITLARENLSLASALEESNIRFLTNGARPSGFITSPNPLKPEQLDRLKAQFGRRASGLENVGKTPVLDNGMEWQRVGLSAEESQFIESRKFSVGDVARWLNIPPHKLKDLERATFSNIEHQQIDYVRGTLRPWAVRHEQCMNVKLLTERERRLGLFISYNIDGLLRGDTESRSSAQRTYFEIGGLTPNEIRAQENRNPVDGGDRPFIRMDMMPLDRVDEIQSVETDAEGRTRVEFAKRETRTEFRSPSARLALRDAFRPLFLQAAGRMVRGELRNVRRMIGRVEDVNELSAWLTMYYMDEHPPFARDVMGPVFESYAESVSTSSAAEIGAEVTIDSVVYAGEYTDVFVNRYSANSRRQLQGLDALDAVEQRLMEWDEGTGEVAPRFEQVAGREIVRMSDAVARATWVAGGITAFVWRTLGDSCPYCLRLDGRVVSRLIPFIPKGMPFEGEGTDVPLTPSSNVNHAPAHRGCDCTIVPGSL